MFPVLFIAFVIDVLGGDEAQVGIIRGMAAFGGLVAAVVVGRLAARADPTKLMMWGYAGLGAVALLFVNITAVTTALWVFLLLFALSGFPNLTSQVGADTTAQRICPPIDSRSTAGSPRRDGLGRSTARVDRGRARGRLGRREDPAQHSGVALYVALRSRDRISTIVRRARSRSGQQRSAASSSAASKSGHGASVK